MSDSCTGVSISSRSGHFKILPVRLSWSACSQGATEAVKSVASRTTVSAGGGNDPVWSGDGRTLYYLKFMPESRGTIFAADISVSRNAMTVGTPRELVRHGTNVGGCSPRCYDVTDGPRFLVSQPSESLINASVRRMDLVLNWTSTLGTDR